MTIAARLHPALQPFVDSGALAGAATLTWRDGVAEVVCVGRRDIHAGLPMERDTIFRIASLTKPVTAVAALSLLDEGRFALDDAITDVAPELTELRVLLDTDGPLDHTEPAARPITFRDLLTHRSGLTYGDFHRGPIGRAYADTLGTQIDNPRSPDAWIGALATVPLVDQPGRGFHYGVSSDLLGLLVARMDGTSLGVSLTRRVLEPLGMRDTGFVVPASSRARRAAPCGFDEAGAPTTLATVPGGHALPERPAEMTFESGGQGLWSTLDDYLRFARLLLGDGALDGIRVLRPDTCRLMRSNQLSPEQRASARMFGRPIFATGHGYGLGVAVVMEPEKADPLRCRGSVGTVGWPGAYGGWWQADPGDGSVLIFLTHNMAELAQMAGGVGLGVWSAIARFHALSTARA